MRKVIKKNRIKSIIIVFLLLASMLISIIPVFASEISETTNSVTFIFEKPSDMILEGNIVIMYQGDKTPITTELNQANNWKSTVENVPSGVYRIYDEFYDFQEDINGKGLSFMSQGEFILNGENIIIPVYVNDGETFLNKDDNLVETELGSFGPELKEYRETESISAYTGNQETELAIKKNANTKAYKEELLKIEEERLEAEKIAKMELQKENLTIAVKVIVGIILIFVCLYIHKRIKGKSFDEREDI